MSEPMVTYSVKDILTRIEGKLDAVTGVHAGRLDNHETRLGKLESEKEGRRERRLMYQWLIGAAAAVAAAVTSLVIALHG